MLHLQHFKVYFLVNVIAPSIDGVIVRDFAFTDDRHHGIYPAIVQEDDISLPIQGSDLVEVLSKVSLDLSQIMSSPISLSVLISNFDHSSQNELEMDIQFGQELVVLNKEAQIKIEQNGGDRWASMDDADDQESELELTYEPELQDFAVTIQGFQKQNFSQSDWLLCLRLKARGRLEGVGNNIRGKAKVELEDIGLVPKQK